MEILKHECRVCRTLFVPYKKTNIYCSKKCKKRRYYLEYKDLIFKKAPKYTIKWIKTNPEKYKNLRKAYRLKNITKFKEKNSLFKLFGTTKVQLVCKKILAIKRCLKKGVLKRQILTSITEGKTHEAYI